MNNVNKTEDKINSSTILQTKYLFADVKFHYLEQLNYIWIHVYL